MSTSMDVCFVVLGEPASKANSRKFVRLNGMPRLIKSEKARNYVRDFQRQCLRLDPLMQGDLAVEIVIHYASRRPDLDEAVILDAMQGLIYQNDRQVKEKHIFHRLDRENPRAEIKVRRLK